MRVAVLAVVLLAGTAAPVRAQGNTQEALDRAVTLFEELQVERALTMLRQIISPASPYEVTREQRVRAYQYIGASLAIVGMRDSAVVYFRAAIERDPFVDLDPARFTELERGAFAEARLQLFAIGVRPLRETHLDPATERLTLAFATTHVASMTAEMRHVGSGMRIPLFAGSTDGVREIGWNGLDASGRIAPEGRYEVVFAGSSLHNDRADSARLYLDLRHDREPLEDTLPSLRPDELLPERHPPSAAPLELAKGLGLAASALVLPTVVTNGDLNRGDRRLVTAVAGAAAATGIVASIRRHRNRDLPANIAINRQRILERAATNAQIVQRNSARLAATRLRISPAAGITQ